jgi:predicted MFS family arabinose efflux permease
LAAETSIYQSVFIVGPLLVTALVSIGSPSLVIGASAAVTVLGTVTLARGRAMRTLRPRPQTTQAYGLGPLRIGGFPAVLVCAAGLGAAFGAVTVTVPAFATEHGSGSGALAGALFAVLGIGSVLGGIWFGARPRHAPLPRQFAGLLAAVAVSYAVFAMMPGPAALAFALFLGGTLVAPVLTVENSLVGRITPAAMRTEAYTWVVTVEVAASAVGLQATGLIVDQPGGVPWAFLSASAAVGLAAVVAALPAGSIARADSALPETASLWGRCS